MTMILLTLAGVIVSIVVGTFWYSPTTPMGRLHMKYTGFDKLSKKEQLKKMEESKSYMPKLYGAQMLLSLLTSFAVVFIVTLSLQNGVPFYMALGFVIFNWLSFMVPVVGSNIIWGPVDRKIAWQKFFSDSLSFFVTISLIAFLTNFFLSFF